MDALRKAREHLASLPFTAAGLVGRTIKVIFDKSATTASTNGKVITMPALPLPTSEKDVEGAEELSTLVRGFIHHEAGHCNTTDFEAGLDFRSEAQINHALVNILEDPREERHHIACWPGSKKWLDAIPALLRKRQGSFPVLTDTMPPASILTLYTLYIARAVIRRQEWFEALAAESRPSAIAVLGESVVARLEGLIEIHGPAMSSTADAVELARRVVGMLEEESQDPPAEPEDDDEGEGDSGDGSDASGDSGENEADADSRGSGSDNSDAEGEADGDQADASGNGRDPSGPDATQRAAIKDALKDTNAGNMAKDLGDELNAGLQTAIQELDPSGNADLAESSKVDLMEARGITPPDYTPNESFSPVNALATSSRLRAVLQERFRTLTTARYDEARKGSRLNQRRIHRLSCNDARVFIRTTDRRQLDTAVFLLADISSSMSTAQRIKMASDAMLCTAVALSGLPGVKVAAGTFPGLFSVLKFGQSPLSMSQRFGLPCFGTTPMDEGIRWATSQLAHRSEARKVLLVMTDGEPDNPRTAKAAIEAAQASGVEVMAIGINHSGVQTLFADSVVIADLPELPRAMMSMLGKSLEASLAA